MTLGVLGRVLTGDDRVGVCIVRAYGANKVARSFLLAYGFRNGAHWAGKDDHPKEDRSVCQVRRERKLTAQLDRLKTIALHLEHLYGTRTL